MVLIGGIGLTGLEDPVSIWTTCLNEDVSAWTKVVGYGFEFGFWCKCDLGVDGEERELWWLWRKMPPLLLLLLLVLLVLVVVGDGRELGCPPLS